MQKILPFILLIYFLPPAMDIQADERQDKGKFEKRLAELRSQPRYWGGVRFDLQTIHPLGMHLLSGDCSSTKPRAVMAILPKYLNASNEAHGLEFHVLGHSVSYDAGDCTFSYSILMESGDYMLVECISEMKGMEQKSKCLLFLKREKFFHYSSNYRDEPKTRQESILVLKGKFQKDPSASLIKRIMAEGSEMPSPPVSDKNAEDALNIHPWAIQLFYGNIADAPSYVVAEEIDSVNASKEALSGKVFNDGRWTGYDEGTGFFKYRIVPKKLPAGFFMVAYADLPHRASGSFGGYMLLMKAKWKFYENEEVKNVEALIRIGDSVDEPSDEAIKDLFSSFGSK